MEMQSRKIDETTSKRITALRFLLMIFVVFIHNNFTAKSIAEILENGEITPLFNQGVVGKWIQLFISNGIGRGAVPLFFLFAAYLQTKKDDRYSILLKKKAKSLLLPFVLWTAFYVFTYGGIKLIVLQVLPQFVSHPDNTIFTWSAADWFHKILGYRKTISTPAIAFQFWFLRDLIILTAISPILKFFIRKYPASFLFAFSFIYVIPLRTYFVETQALFYYSLGLYWGMYDIPLFEKIDKIDWAESIIVFLLSFFITWRFFNSSSTVYWLMVLAACVILLKLSGVIAVHDKVFKTASYLAVFSFFLFAAHAPALQEIIRRVWLRFFPMKNQFFCIFEYFGVNILTILIGTGAGILLRKAFPRFFGLITGGRMAGGYYGG
jgi:Acyltransferase family.